MRMSNLSGQRFGRLVALWPAGRRKTGKSTCMVWACQCDDGHVVAIRLGNLTTGKARSCGCLRSDTARQLRTTHGHTPVGHHTTENRAYWAARRRCTYPLCHNYHRYGGRGIKFLFRNFEEFLADIGLKPSPELTLDRKNPDGNYEPGNIRWATVIEQRHNRSKL